MVTVLMTYHKNQLLIRIKFRKMTFIIIKDKNTIFNFCDKTTMVNICYFHSVCPSIS